jgi:hypothetical protein
VFRQKTGKKSERGGAGSVECFYNCEGGTNAKSHFFGELSPLIHNNGTTIGLKPGEIEVDAGSGELESESGGFGGVTVAGLRKVQGYAAQELIEVKNP